MGGKLSACLACRRLPGPVSRETDRRRRRRSSGQYVSSASALAEGQASTPPSQHRDWHPLGVAPYRCTQQQGLSIRLHARRRSLLRRQVHRRILHMPLPPPPGPSSITQRPDIGDLELRGNSLSQAGQLLRLWRLRYCCRAPVGLWPQPAWAD